MSRESGDILFVKQITSPFLRKVVFTYVLENHTLISFRQLQLMWAIESTFPNSRQAGQFGAKRRKLTLNGFSLRTDEI